MLKNAVVLITGASRGIGAEFAKCLAKQNANLILLAKTLEAHPKLEGSLNSVAKEISKYNDNVKCLLIACDIRNAEQVKSAIDTALKSFEKIDILINNASAIDLSNIETLPIKKYDLIHDINVKGTYSVITQSLPYLLKSKSAQVVTLSPPINTTNPIWFTNHLGYTQSKYAMSLLTIAFAEEYKGKIKFFSLWPKTAIYTAAMELLAGGVDCKNICRKPQIMSDALLHLLQNGEKTQTGQCYVDEQVLTQKGVTDFTQYSCVPGQEKNLWPDLFLD